MQALILKTDLIGIYIYIESCTTGKSQ